MKKKFLLNTDEKKKIHQEIKKPHHPKKKPKTIKTTKKLTPKHKHEE